MAITITNVDAPDSDTYYRIFQEALPKIGHETARIGEDNLRRDMIRRLHSCDVCQEISLDGYVVGYIACEYLTFRGLKYKHIFHPTLGTDQSGSRSWYYSADYQTASDQRNQLDGVKGFITIHNPGSPAANSVPTRYATSTIEVLSVESVLPERTDYPTNQRAFVVTFPED